MRRPPDLASHFGQSRVIGIGIGIKSFDPTSSSLVNPFANPLANGVGIIISSSNNRIGGTLPLDRNVIQGNEDAGVILSGPLGTGNLVEGNYILDNAADGVRITTSNNFIGEAIGDGPAGGGNIISGNLWGVLISGPDATGNIIVNNEIGTDVGRKGTTSVGADPIRGMQPRPNIHDGILIQDAPGNVIGGTIGNDKNVIASNGLDGVNIQNAQTDKATGNQVLGNWIGYNQRGSVISLLPNRDGVNISSANNVVGGTSVADRNIIINNAQNGVTISDKVMDINDHETGSIPMAEPKGNLVAGNFIGTRGGADDYGNTMEGVLITGANVTDNTVGGTTAEAQNVISGNNDGVTIRDPGTTGNVVQGNLIGTMSDGVNVLANAIDGVRVENSPNNLIGGTAAGAGNVISGNNDGVTLVGNSATGNVIQGNFIGTDAKAAVSVRNAIDGVHITDGASQNIIGGTDPGAGNAIDYNLGAGVNVRSSTGNAILSNQIFANNRLGIDLFSPSDPPTGVTPNHPGGAIAGANYLQNAPVLTSVTSGGSSTGIVGTFNGTPSTTFTLQFFTNTAAHRSGYGEGQTVLGTTTLQTDASGNAPLAINLPTSIPAGTFVSATATDPGGNTSEFSNTLPGVPISVQFSVGAYTVNQADGTATIIVTRGGGTGGLVTVSYATSDGTATAGTDYTASSGTLTFNPDQASTTFTVPIIDNHQVGPDKTVNITLSNPTNGSTLGTPSTATLTIRNTNTPTLQFSADSYSVNEGDGSVTLTVTRNTPLATSTISYATGGGSAVPDVDYQPTSGTLTFNPGQISQTFTVPILDAGRVGEV